MTAPRTGIILVWGAGGHGRVVADVARASGWTVVGFADRDEARVGSSPVHGAAPVIISEAALRAAIASGTALPGDAVAIAMGVGGNAARFSALSWLPPAYLPVLTHPAATISPSAVLGPGTVVMAGAVVNADARIGAGVILNTRAVVEHDVCIGIAAHISPGAVLTGAVEVGERAWVGAGAVVIPGRRIGSDSIVGAGAVVLTDVPQGVTVVGNPARSRSSDSA